MEKPTSVTQNRESYIGGSDIPILMDLSFFKTRITLLQEKAGYKTNTFKGNEYTEYGNILEPKIRDYINKTYSPNDHFNEDSFIANSKDGKLGVRCNVDGMNNDTILEIKTTSNIKKDIEDYKVYLVQLLFYMLNANKKKGILAVYQRTDFEIPEQIDKDKLQIFNVDIDDYKDLVDEILSSVDKFQDDLTLIKENPNLTEEDLINPLIVENTKKVVALENRLKGLKLIEQELKDTKDRLFEDMRKFNVKKWKTINGVTISRVDESSTTKETLNTKKLKAEVPDVYDKYKESKTTTRKGYVRVTFDNNHVNNEFKVEKENK